ncbi:hypothetical protein CLF_104480 [Clonorchis sinensis]|uniref:Uncharacterized protein n=1 Tax=Clonorchis sinensis TaxID=79923 RepID=G7YNU1_CLOSI|nr:hypothetical protein CLF_104480 [Clonorchis sinensis]
MKFALCSKSMVIIHPQFKVEFKCVLNIVLTDSITRKILRKKLALYIDRKSPEGDFSGERTTSSDGIRLRAEGKQRSAAVRTNENASVKTNWARIAIVLCLLALIPVVIYVRVFA